MNLNKFSTYTRISVVLYSTHSMTSFPSSLYIVFPLSLTETLCALHASIVEGSYCFDIYFDFCLFFSFMDFTNIFTLCFLYLFENLTCLSTWMSCILAPFFVTSHLSHCIFLHLSCMPPFFPYKAK